MKRQISQRKESANGNAASAGYGSSGGDSSSINEGNSSSDALGRRVSTAANPTASSNVTSRSSASSSNQRQSTITPSLAVSGPVAPVAFMGTNVSLSSATTAAAESSTSAFETDDSIDNVVGQHMEAMYAFEAGGSGEMSLNKGDVIKVTKVVDEGWWIGNCGSSKSGMFPSNYVQPTNKPVGPAAAASSAYSSSSMGNATRKDSSSSSSFNNVAAASRGSTSSSFSAHHPPSSKTSAMTSCGQCGCNEFNPNVFKPKQCNNCFHEHH